MDSLTAACNSGPSPGRGFRIKSRSVSKLSGKSMSIGGFMFLSLRFVFHQHSKNFR